MKQIRILILGIFLVGCCGISTEDKKVISYQAARFDRAVALINSGVSQKDLENFVRAERKVWHALNFSVNNIPLPPDLAPVSSK